MSTLPRTAVFGGAFNPVHKGHLALAEELWSRFDLSTILFVPTGSPPHKDLSGDPGARHRIQMLEDAVAGRKGWHVLPNEIDRSGKSYTVSTLEELGLPERPWLIVGTDAFSGFLDWKDPKGILDRADLLIASRPGTSFSDVLPVVEGVFLIAGGAEHALSTVDTASLDSGMLSLWLFSWGPVPFRLCLVRVNTPDISSTMVREFLSKTDESGSAKKEILPTSVKSYIVEKELFGEE